MSEETKERRPKGDGGLYYDAKRGRYVATRVVGVDERGKDIRRYGYGKTKKAASDNLKKNVAAYNAGLTDRSAAKYTVNDAVKDWILYGHGDVDDDTLKRHEYLVAHVTKDLGEVRLRLLKAKHVEKMLKARTTTHATSTLRDIRWALSQVIRRAMAHDLVDKNVADLVTVPRGTAGRKSKALTLEQAVNILTLTKADAMYPYIVVSLLGGLRTEEVRALPWERVNLDGDPATIDVWQSVRKDGDTKTARSRRSMEVPELVGRVLRRWQKTQEGLRAKAGDQWTQTGLVFTTSVGTGLDAANVRRDFRRALALVPGIVPAEWTPRELRHSFVSLLSAEGVRIEEIARLVGHSGTAVTERIYRHELRPVLQTGARAMDAIFEVDDVAPDWHMEPLFSVPEALGETRE